MKKLITLLALAFCLNARVFAQALCFNSPTNFGVDANPEQIISNDFNGDGKPDLAIVNYGSNDISILVGIGNGSFNPASNLTLGLNLNSIISSDFNGDGKVDLAVGGGSKIYVLLELGNGSFVSATNFTVSNSIASINNNDFNGDGFQDLAVINGNSSGEHVSILLGTGTGSFGAETNFSAGGWPSNIISADFNGDGKIDLAAPNANGLNYVSVLLGSGTGSFSSASNFTVGTTPSSIISNDFNGDGKTDLAIANSGSSNITILLGVGSGSFGTATNFAVCLGPTSIISADFNGDGILDLAVANYYSNNASILLGTSTGSFGLSNNFTTGTYTAPESIISADFNGDGKADFATANYNGNNISVLLNCDATTGVSQISDLNSNISIYPNPNNGSFVIEPNSATKQTMQVYDVNGKMVLSQIINGRTSIDASSLNEGVYNISIISNEGVVNKRLVIVR